MKQLIYCAILLLGFALPAHAVVNINTATAEQLEGLNGIGPAKAEAIVEYRKKNGNFKSVDDLNQVPGIGDKTMAKLRPELTVSGAPSAPSNAPTGAAPSASSSGGSSSAANSAKKK